MQDLQAEQEQGTQAQGWVAHLRCSLKSELEKGSRTTGGWTELFTGESRKATRGSGVATEGICASYRKRSKTEEEDREARK